MKTELKGESMAFGIKRVEYYYIAVEGHVEEGSKMLSVFADVGVNLLTFQSAPLGPMRTRFTLFPDDGLKMTDGAKKAGLTLDGPHSALLIKGDNDESAALACIYEKLSQADINVYASNGIADIKGGYGVILYFKQEEYQRAVAALEV
jgi:hypothetical protein